MMKRALIVGGANGIGLAIAKELSASDACEKVYIVDKAILAEEYQDDKIESFVFDLTSADYSFFNRFTDIDSLFITAGFGKLSLFKDLDEQYIINSFNVNTIACIRIIKHFYNRLLQQADFYCGVMVSIAIPGSFAESFHDSVLILIISLFDATSIVVFAFGFS